MGRSEKGLATVGSRALSPPWRVAPSLERARRGEVLVLDGQGQVLGPRAARWLAVQSALGFTLVAGLVAVVAMGALHSTLAGLVVLGAFGVGSLRRVRVTRDFRRAASLAAAGQRDEALRAFLALEARGTPDHLGVTVDLMVARLAWQGGDLAHALERYERVLALTGQTPRAARPAAWWVAAFDRAQVLAISGRLEDALALRATLQQPPTGDYFVLEAQLTDLVLAFHSGAPEALPEELHDWAVAALKTNRYALSLVLLAWAFQARGDDDMARHLAAEVPDRAEGSFLPRVCPRAWAWLRGAVRGWATGG